MYVVNILGYLAFGLSIIFILSVLPAFFKDLIDMSIEFFIVPVKTSISKRIRNLLISKETILKENEDEYYKESA